MSQTEVENLLRENPKGLTVKEMMDRLGHCDGTIYSNLKNLRKWKMITLVEGTKPQMWKLLPQHA